MSTKKAIVFAVLFFPGCFRLFSQSTRAIKTPGLTGKVEVLRDTWGVNHIYATNQHDLFFAQGYCAAKDRLFQFEIWRRQATGTVAELLGERELARDIGTRLFKFRGNMHAELQRYHPQGAAIIQAYVDGVNACISESIAHPGQLPVEFKLLHTLPQPWTPDVVISRHQGLLGNITDEIKTGRAVAAIGERQVKDLMWFHPKDPVIALDPTIDSAMLAKDILQLYTASHSAIKFRQEDVDAAAAAGTLDVLNSQVAATGAAYTPDMEGSNNWIVGPSRTAGGHAMLANDPHRGIAVPSLRYMVHLVAPGWNVEGGGEPEIPGVSIGHNEHGAWGLTIFETDGEDLYVYDLNPANLQEYRYRGNWVKFTSIEETIPVKNAAPRKVTLYYSRHGPVTFIDSARHKAYAVRCAWLQPGSAPYLAALRMDQATGWKSFREACSYSFIPAENMVWADRKGNIGWQAVGIAPVRRNFSGLVPVPGDGRYEWDGFLPIKELPHVLNPPKGFFATANQQVTPPDYTHWNAIGYNWADDYRGDRINDVLQSNNHITMQELEALQTDYYSLPATALVPLLSPLSFSDPVTADFRMRVLGWNRQMLKTSVCAGVYNEWEKLIVERASREWIPAVAAKDIVLQLTTVINKLQHPGKLYDDDAGRKRDDFIRSCFQEAIDTLRAKLGPDTARWQYGQAAYKHVLMVHPLGRVSNDSMNHLLNVGPLPRGGSGHTVGSTGSSDNQVHGASFRIVADTGDWDNTVMINTPGQSGDPRSPFYKNLFSLWANDGYFPAYYSRKKIEAVTVDKTVLTP